MTTRSSNNLTTHLHFDDPRASERATIQNDVVPLRIALRSTTAVDRHRQHLPHQVERL